MAGKEQHLIRRMLIQLVVQIFSGFLGFSKDNYFLACQLLVTFQLLNKLFKFGVSIYSFPQFSDFS